MHAVADVASVVGLANRGGGLNTLSSSAPLQEGGAYEAHHGVGYGGFGHGGDDGGHVDARVCCPKIVNRHLWNWGVFG